MVKHFTLLIIATLISISVFGQYPNITINKELQDILNSRNPSLKNKQANLVKTDLTRKEKLDSIIEYNFNEITNAWDKKYAKDTYEYNEDLKDTLWVYSSWNKENNTWNNLLKEELYYDDQGNIMSYLFYSWWGAVNNWNRVTKKDYTYNDENELTEELIYGWEKGLNDWVPMEKKAYSYDSNGYSVKDSTSIFQSTSQEWRLKEKTDNEYINGKLHSIIKSNWDSDTSIWVYSKKERYNHDFYDETLLAIYSHIWDQSIQDWKLEKIESFGYDVDGYANAYSKTSRNLNISDEWNNRQTDRYSFDYTANINDLIFPYLLEPYYELFFHHKVTNKKLNSYNFDTKLDRQYRNVEYYYSDSSDVLDIDDIKQDVVSIYPNPAKGNFNINLPSNYKQGVFELFDIKGSKLLITTIFDGDNINVNFLAPGVYIYRVIINKKIKTGKLIIV